jgi:uncharacterized membrane-anchored protein
VKNLNIALLVATLIQILVLGGMYVSASMPLWVGQEVWLETRPVDPRSLFRGNYARLSYDISTISSTEINDPGVLRHGEVIYVSLKEEDASIWTFASASLEMPSSGVFIRGRIQYPTNQSETLQVNYGIEAFFAPKDKAIALEKDLRTGATAVLMVTGGGKASLQRILPSS